MELDKDKIAIYDSGDDSLAFIDLNRGIRTINTGFMLLTVDKKGKITAIELMGAHKNFRIPKEVLENMQNAKINISFSKEKKKVFINILIGYKREQESPISISEDVSRFRELVMENQEIIASLPA